MGMWEWLLGRPTTLEVAVSAVPRTFAVDETSIPYEVFGIGNSTDPTAPVSKISRKSARQIPAVKRARDIICGTLGGIPMQLIDTDNEVQPNPLLDQPEDNVPRSVTLTRLFEDLLFESVAWWKITQTDYRGYPTKVLRIEPEKVTITDGRVYVDGRPVEYNKIIRFDSPNGGLLSDGARALKTLLRLEASAANVADDPVPSGYFSPVDGADPLEDEEIAALLTAWRVARQKGHTGYVPAALQYRDLQFSPKDLQLVEARQHAVLEIARLTGIDAEDLSVSTTSRTYFNGQDRRMQRISDVLGPYSLAVTDRLRMRDVTPRGYSVRADFSGFLRADDQTRLENYKAGLDLGLYSLEQVADREGLPAPEGIERTQAAKTVVREAEGITQEEVTNV